MQATRAGVSDLGLVAMAPGVTQTGSWELLAKQANKLMCRQAGSRYRVRLSRPWDGQVLGSRRYAPLLPLLQRLLQLPSLPRVLSLDVLQLPFDRRRQPGMRVTHGALQRRQQLPPLQVCRRQTDPHVHSRASVSGPRHRHAGGRTPRTMHPLVSKQPAEMGRRPPRSA